MMRFTSWLAGIVLITLPSSDARGDWTLKSASEFYEPYSVAVLGGDRFCMVGWAAGSLNKFKYFYSNSSVTGIAASNPSGEAYWQGVPSLLYLSQSDKLCMIVPWAYTDTNGSGRFGEVYTNLYEYAPGNIEDGYASNDRWTLQSTDEYWSLPANSSFEYLYLDAQARATTKVVDGEDLIAAALVYTTERQLTSGETWQTGDCSHIDYESMTVVRGFQGSYADIGDVLSFAEPILGSSGDDTSCNISPTCLPCTPILNTLDYQWNWSVGGQGSNLTTVNVALEGETPIVGLLEIAESDYDLWTWGDVEAGDDAFSGHELVASGDTANGTVTWAPYGTGGAMHYKYRENGGSLQTGDLYVFDEDMQRIPLSGWPRAVGTLDNGSMVLTYTTYNVTPYGLKCAIVPPGGDWPALSVSDVWPWVGSTSGLHTMDIEENQIAVAFKYLEDEDDESSTTYFAHSPTSLKTFCYDSEFTDDWTEAGVWGDANGYMLNVVNATSEQEFRQQFDNADFSLNFDYKVTTSSSSGGPVYVRFRKTMGGGPLLQFYAFADKMQLLSYNGSTFSTLDEDLSFDTDVNVQYNVRILAVGSNVEVWRGVDGGAQTLVLSTNSASVSSGNALSFHVRATAVVQFDNICFSTQF